ncbi:MAG: hypothetical protein JW849_08430 [Phycisphaerae bacterium]|nr:hypothetical protein [Phycisphaerae bacterium]
MSPRSTNLLVRSACSLVLLAVGQLIVVQGVAMAQYPGGHEWNRQAPGHNFWRNTLCDLGKTAATNGQPNPMSLASRVSVMTLFLSFGPLWLILPRLFPDRRRIGLLVRVLGMLSLGGMMGIGLTPTDQYPSAHAVANGLASVPGLAAYLLACWAMFFSKYCPRILTAVSLVLLALGLIHFGQYVAHFWLGRAWTPEAPAVQRLAFLAGIAWMVLTAGFLWRRAEKKSS